MARRKTSGLAKDTFFISIVLLTILLLAVPVVWKLAIALLLILGASGYLAWYFRKVKTMRMLGLAEIDQMSGVEFKKRLWLLFKDMDYHVQPTPASGDWGADLIVSKDGVRTVVQAKRYSKPVGVTAIQEVVTARAKYNCTNSLVVTNNQFTPQAQALAFANGTELWDRGRLIEKLNTTQK